MQQGNPLHVLGPVTLLSDLAAQSTCENIEKEETEDAEAFDCSFSQVKRKTRKRTLSEKYCGIDMAKAASATHVSKYQELNFGDLSIIGSVLEDVFIRCEISIFVQP